jgi:GNAT superfamily N-acetyltransferase
MSDTITTRILEDTDVERVLELLRAALGEPPLLKRTPALFAWKHFDNPFGPSVAILAESDERIVGLRTFMRWDLLTPAGSTVRCVRAVDTATHPDHHRRGIFRRLTEEALEIASAQGVDLVFNTPNERSGAGYVTMGWREVGPVGVLVRPSPRLVLGASASDATDPSRFIDDPEPVGSLRVADREPRGLRTPRGEAYLRWRFGSHPTARYFRVERNDSVAVVRPNVRGGRRELVLADVFGARPAGAIRRAARRSRSAYLAAWFSAGTPERRAALRSGLVPVPGLNPLTLMARPLHDLDVDVFDMSNWDLAVSDLELL